MGIRKAFLTVIFRVIIGSSYTAEWVRNFISDNLKYGVIENYVLRPDKLAKVIAGCSKDSMHKDFADGTYYVYDVDLSDERDLVCCWPNIYDYLRTMTELNFFDIGGEGIRYVYGNYSFGEMGKNLQVETPVGGEKWKRTRRR